MFPDKLRVSSFPDRFPHYAYTASYSAYTDFVGSRAYACLGVTCHLHYWQNDRDIFAATAVTRGVERTPDKSHHTTLTLEKKILPPLLSRFELSTFRSRARRSYQQTIPTTRIGLVYIIIMFGKCTFYKQQAERHRDGCFARE